MLYVVCSSVPVFSILSCPPPSPSVDTAPREFFQCQEENLCLTPKLVLTLSDRIVDRKEGEFLQFSLYFICLFWHIFYISVQWVGQVNWVFKILKQKIWKIFCFWENLLHMRNLWYTCPISALSDVLLGCWNWGYESHHSQEASLNYFWKMKALLTLWK